MADGQEAYVAFDFAVLSFFLANISMQHRLYQLYQVRQVTKPFTKFNARWDEQIEDLITR